MSDDGLVIRPAEPGDLPALGVLGARLAHLHHGFDSQRFLQPGPTIEQGYARFLGEQLTSADALVVVATRAEAIIGYAYATIEPLSWESLRDEAGFVHDLIVDDANRRQGVGTRLLDAAFTWLRGRGMPRVVLHAAFENPEAQRLFARLGFRPTMIEMTRELS